MAAMSDWLENAVIEHFLRNNAQTAPAALWLALFSTATTDAGGGTEAGAPYTRQSVAFGAAAGGVAVATADVTFTMPAGTWTHGAIVTSGVIGGGNFILHGALGTPFVTVLNQVIVLAAADVIAAFQ